jgi:[acyl-carrier-protein] S-malonyltransferase
MLPAEQKMREFFKDIEFKTARIPVVQNLTSTAHTQPEELKENLLKQVSSPVRWEESMKFILRMGCLTGIELGHGQVLKGLLKKTLGDEFSVINLETSADLGTAKKYWSAT